TQDAAAAVEEQTASLAAFAATAEQLKGAAEDLDGLVGRFKV
ncbi:MAG: histidine kinase, partial [Selenomonas sp.]|nr:histidine kinase [Selenomonas sp.]